MTLDYTITAGRSQSRFLRALINAKILGAQCGTCRKVTVPPRGACPTCAVLADALIEVGEVGTVTSFCLVNIAFAGQAQKVPYAYAWILLDGADVAFAHVIQSASEAFDISQVHTGMRVRAVWAAPAARAPTFESILYFCPAEEGDSRA